MTPAESLDYQIARLEHRFDVWGDLRERPGIPAIVIERQLILIADAAVKARDIMRAQRGVYPERQVIRIPVRAIPETPLTIAEDSSDAALDHLFRALGIDDAVPTAPN